MAELLRVGVWVYTALSVAGVALAVVTLVDGATNLIVVLRLRHARTSAAWLWLAIGATAFITQLQHAVIGLYVVIRPPVPIPAGELGGYVVLVAGIGLAALIVLAIQIVTVFGRSALRHRP